MPSTDTLIRALHADDAAAFQALRLRGLREDPVAFASSAEEEQGEALQAVAARLQGQGAGAVFGAWRSGVLVGVAGIQRESMRKLAHKAFLWGMYVAPEARRGGLGRQLVRMALDHARDVLGVRQVNLGVHAHNAPALALYLGLGFEAFGLERGCMVVDGRDVDEVHMACRVGVDRA